MVAPCTVHGARHTKNMSLIPNKITNSLPDTFNREIPNPIRHALDTQIGTTIRGKIKNPLRKKTKMRYHFLRWSTQLWTVILFSMIILDFLHNNAFLGIVEPLAVLYIATLALYSAEKEFERWYEFNIGRHPGEAYVVLWTILLSGIIVAEVFTHKHYHLPSEVVATYIGVLGILAITRKSKELYIEKDALEPSVEYGSSMNEKPKAE